MAQIVIFGDSITFGMWDESGGWPVRVNQYYTKRVLESNLEEFISVYGMGIPGNTTEDLLTRFEFEMTQRINLEQVTTIIFAIGVNDSHFINTHGDHAVALEVFEHNIRRLYELAKKYAQHIAFVGLTMVDESKTHPLYWIVDRSYRNQWIEKYDQIIRSVCDEKEIPFIDIFSEYKNNNHHELLSDGLHPNTNGHKLIADKVIEHLDKFAV